MTTTIKKTLATGHRATLDLECFLLTIEGDADFDEDEIQAFCAAHGVRCTWDLADPKAPDDYRVERL